MRDDSTAEFKKTLLLADLLKQTTSLAVLSEFLKSRGLHHSAGSWEVMRDKRILPAVEAGDLTNADLIEILSSSEECGGQHVFLYKCTVARAAELMDRKRIQNVLKRRGLTRLLTEADVLVQPAVPQIVDVRWESAKVDLNLTVKEVELRTHRAFIGTEIQGDRFLKIYTNEQQRAVNVAKLHRNGLLEIRLASHRQSSKYDADVNRFFTHLAEIIPFHGFSEVSLGLAKRKLLAEAKSGSGLVRLTDATVRDGEGNLLHAATGSDNADLSKDKAISKSLESLLESDKDAYCSDSNLWFVKQGALTSDIHVLLNGATNEFSLPGQCGVGDYNYVLDQVRRFNK